MNNGDDADTRGHEAVDSTQDSPRKQWPDGVEPRLVILAEAAVRERESIQSQNAAATEQGASSVIRDGIDLDHKRQMYDQVVAISIQHLRQTPKTRNPGATKQAFAFAQEIEQRLNERPC